MLGDDLHYGLFADGGEDLSTATGALTDRMVAAGQITAGCEVLDVGCGTGAPACQLASLGAQVTGITTSEVGVDAATRRAQTEGLAERVRFIKRDGMDNCFPDSSFDRVWVLESSHLMRDRPRLMAECARVLRPGGRLALCDIVLRREMPFDEVRRLVRPLRLLVEVFGDAHMEPLSSYVELAKAQGLEVEEATDLTDLTRPTFARWRERALRHESEVVASIGRESWSAFVASMDVLDGFWEDGTLGYGLLAAAKP
jgi:27-O-demethylrifamycin SV methyltransferase